MQLRITGAILLSLLVGCSSGGDGAATPASLGSSADVSCSLTDLSDRSTFTRFEVPPGSEWDVVYGVFRNDCSTPVVIRVLQTSVQNADIDLLGLHARIPAPEKILAIEPHQVANEDMGPTTLRTGESALVIGRVKVGVASSPLEVPDAEMWFETPTTTSKVSLTSGARLCSCASPPG